MVIAYTDAALPSTAYDSTYFIIPTEDVASAQIRRSKCAGYVNESIKDFCDWSMF